MNRNPTTHAELLALPVGPDRSKVPSRTLLCGSGVLAAKNIETNEIWQLWMHTDGTRFRFLSESKPAYGKTYKISVTCPDCGKTYVKESTDHEDLYRHHREPCGCKEKRPHPVKERGQV